MYNSSILCILAGGSSRRYIASIRNSVDVISSDKALLHLKGKTVLESIVFHAKQHYRHVCVSVHSKKQLFTYQKISNIGDNGYVIDLNDIKFKGSLLGIASILQKHPTSFIQFIPVDMPFVPFSLLRKIESAQAGIGFFYFKSGMITSLLSLYGPKIYFPHQFYQLELARSDTLIRLASKLYLYNAEEIVQKNSLNWDIFLNINTIKDIENFPLSDLDIEINHIPKPLILEKRAIDYSISERENIDIETFLNGFLQNGHYYATFLWAKWLKEKEMLKVQTFRKIASQALLMEYQYWKKNKLFFLAYHALLDLVKKFPEKETKELTEEIMLFRKKLKIRSKALKRN